MIDVQNINEVIKIIEEASAKLSALLNQPVEISIIKPDLSIFKNKKKTLSYLKYEELKLKIVHEVSEQYQVSIASILSNSRKKPVPDARKLACFLLKEYIPGLQDGQIAVMLNMDRTTVIYNRQEAEILLRTDKEVAFNFRQLVKKIETSIKKTA